MIIQDVPSTVIMGSEAGSTRSNCSTLARNSQFAGVTSAWTTNSAKETKGAKNSHNPGCIATFRVFRLFRAFRGPTFSLTQAAAHITNVAQGPDLARRFEGSVLGNRVY